LDRLVFGRGEAGIAELPRCVICARPAQRRGSQQAADLIGPKRTLLAHIRALPTRRVSRAVSRSQVKAFMERSLFSYASRRSCVRKWRKCGPLDTAGSSSETRVQLAARSWLV